MPTFHLFAVLLSLAALFGYVNWRTIRLPTTIGILLLSLATTLLVIGVDSFYTHFGLRAALAGILSSADLSRLLLDSLLAFLLFAGAMQVDLGNLLTRKWTILALATAGVALSTGLLGGAFYGIFRVAGLDIPLVWCLVIGAVVSPTDPVAVLGTLRRLGVPRGLEATIAGESMFNDGVAIVLFTVLLGIATGQTTDPSVPRLLGEFAFEFFGAILLGLATGGLAFFMIRSIDRYTLELMLSLALVAGTYSLAQLAHVSGPIAVVVSGLIIGNPGVRYAMSEETRRNLQLFWQLVDDMLNALLFLMIGIEVTAISLDARSLAAAVLAVPLALLVRAISVVVPGLPFHLDSPQKWRGVAILVWAGLRGGISVALALSIPEEPFRAPLLTACYAIVAFTMLVQAPTLPKLVRRAFPQPSDPDAGR